MIDVDVTKRFSGFTAHFSFSVASGRCGVFGPSGSGKTTLMYMLAGLLAPDSGKIVLNGNVLFDHLKRVNVAPEQRRIGIVFQHARLFPHMNVKQNLLFGRKRLPARERVIEPEQLVDILRLDSLLKRSVGSLSGGERQRVALARTILASPRLILLDEPLSGLDGSLKYQIIPYLQQVFSRFSIPFLFISHSPEEMRLMTEQVIIVAGGRVAEIVAVENLARAAAGGGLEGENNLLFLSAPEKSGQLIKYRWGKLPVFVPQSVEAGEGYFSLNRRDILLLKGRPAGISSENMLAGVVCAVEKRGELFARIELDCAGQTLRVEAMAQTVQELGIAPADELTAVFCASALQRI